MMTKTPAVASTSPLDAPRAAAPAGPGPAAPAAAPLRVVVVPADGPLRETTRVLLAGAPGLRAVELGRERARDAEDVARHPEVVLLDLDARARGADAVAREAVARWRPAPVLVVTASEDRHANRALVRAGVRGVVTHAREADHLLAALHRVHDGEIWLARGCMSRLIDEMVGDGHAGPAHLAGAEALDRLTAREREVAELIARGLHNKAIAAALGITDHTVRHHLTAIYAKLGVSDRLELAVYAFRHTGGAPARP